MSQEELIAEQMAIHTCSTLIRWLIRDDPTACKVLEEILQEEESRFGALASLVEGADEVVMRHLIEDE